MAGIDQSNIVTRSLCLAALAAGPLALAPPASGQEITSAYSSFDWQESCEIVDQPGPDEPAMWAVLECAGHDGLPVHIRDGDDRMSLDYGTVGKPGRWESFLAFNHVHTTLEWRLAAGEPFATIHRYFVSDLEGGSRQVLTVNSVALAPDQESCMVALVDAAANEGANVIARDLADTLVRGFACGGDAPRYYGKTTDTTPQLSRAPDE